MNIAFITDRMIKGHGVDLVVDRLADGLAKAGYNCKVYCNYFDETFINRKSYKIEKLHYFKPEANPIIYERRIRKLVPYLNSRNIDLFIIHSFPFYGLVPKLNKPTLIVDYGIVSVEGMPLRRRLRFKYMELSQNLSYFKKADKIVSISKFLLNALPDKLRSKATYIYNGCDHYHLNPISSEEIQLFRKSLGVASNDILLLFVGRLNLSNQPYKGLEELKDIYQDIILKHKNVKLLAVGFGTKNDEELLKNQGVLAISNASEDLMPLFYRSSDIYTTCSHWEGFDLPIAEAHSFSKPTICYRIGAHEEVSIDGKTGFIVDDPRGFYEKLDILISDKKLRKEMGINAKEYSKNFNWKDAVKNYDITIKEIFKDRSPETSNTAVPDKIESLKSDIVTAIVVNYNSSYPCLKACIDSLSRQTYKKLKIMVFDNHSTNGALDSIKKEFKEITIICSQKNLGLGRALNQAIKLIDSEFVFISSFDVIHDHDVVELTVNQLKGLDSTYIGVAPKIKFYYLQDYLESVGIYLDVNLSIGYHGIGQLDLGQYNREEDIFGVSFTSALVRRVSFFNGKVGPIDPDFFLFYEDIDFCYRANLQGYKFRTCPSAHSYHKYAYSFRDDATSFQVKNYYQKLNVLKVAYKNSEYNNLKRILDGELQVQKQNLKDRNLKPFAKKIFSNLRKSRGHLKRQRLDIQFSRQIPDHEVIKFSWKEINYFDFIKNEPIYSIENLHHVYRRLFVIIGNRLYGNFANYLENLQNTKYKIDGRIYRKILHNKFQYEPASVHQFIDKIN